MIVGAITVLVWLYVPLLPTEDGPVPLESLLYAMIPGFFLSGAAAWLVSTIGRSVKPKVAAGFDDMADTMNNGS
jgi:SSS family solute:Na+ symporter/sodium/proline symporter